jgi:hypothetical protein
LLISPRPRPICLWKLNVRGTPEVAIFSVSAGGTDRCYCVLGGIVLGVSGSYADVNDALALCKVVGVGAGTCGMDVIVRRAQWEAQQRDRSISLG